MIKVPQPAQKLIAKCAHSNSGFLFTTAAIGWFLASAAQTFGIITNKKIDKEDKKFLIPQEIADGTMNILLYALVTTPLMWLSGKIFKYKGVAPQTAQFDKLKDGARVVASIAGAVIASNVLTPIARNKLGTIAQRKALHQKIQADEPAYDPYYQPLFQKNYQKTPLKMSTYLAFTKNQSNGMKI